MKPMLMNTKMVKAILAGRKTVTRRLIKERHLCVLDSPYHKEHSEVPDKVLLEKLCELPYQSGDVLYVRESWCKGSLNGGAEQYFTGQMIMIFIVSGAPQSICQKRQQEFSCVLLGLGLSVCRTLL